MSKGIPGQWLVQQPINFFSECLSPFFLLTTDITYKILQYLHVGDICRVGEVCTLLYEVTKAPEVWRSVQFVLKEPENKTLKKDRRVALARWGRVPNLFVPP